MIVKHMLDVCFWEELCSFAISQKEYIEAMWWAAIRKYPCFRHGSTIAPADQAFRCSPTAAVTILLTNNSWVQVLTIALGALAGWKLIRTNAPPEKLESFTRLPNRVQSVTSLAIFGFCLLVLPILAAGKRYGWLPLFDSFYRTGSLVFGGGHVVLPLLQPEVVPKGWEDNNKFLAGYGIAQALPGPIFSFAAYLGAAKSGYPTGEKIGIIFPSVSAPFVGVVETVGGLLLIIASSRGRPPSSF